MYTHFSVVLLLFGPARTHSIMRYVCEYRVHCIKCSRFFRQHAAAAVVACGACTEETGSKRGVNGTRLRQWGLQGYTPVSIDPSGEEGKKGPISLSPQARRPSSYGRAHSSFVPLTTNAAVAVTTYAAVVYRSPVAAQLVALFVVPLSTTAAAAAVAVTTYAAVVV